ncbi:MAG: glutamate synthase subunit beta [Lactobacillus sp.]|jgi:glutamate synthase (NADPH/NADH) small chain|nr:glutamate synthase subunit beta [Lactobacillus sp.]MCI2032486.1 glutamate synthase subunit beta [Lactobacillus sp.]
MSDPFGFMKYTRKDNPWRDPKSRIADFNEMELTLSDDERRQQALRCMNCGVPHCHVGYAYAGGKAVSGCPNDNLIPEWQDFVGRNEDKRAFQRLTLTNPLPDFTGHVCPAPCEVSCNEALHNKGITIRNNERFIIDQAFKYGWVEESGRPLHRNGIKIAVVGSGPAGLTAAWRLNQLGYSVTVYEADDKPGGLVQYGIPNMKLPKEDVARRVAVMAKVGITFICNTRVGVDISGAELRAQYARVLLAIGARMPRELQAPGRELEGIDQALDFLTTATKAVAAEGPAANQKLAGKRIVVVGGGDTGNDCIATALRLGARDILQLEIAPAAPSQRPDDNPWPEWPRTQRLGYGQSEYAALSDQPLTHFAETITAFHGDDNGHVDGITIAQADHFQPVANTEFDEPADLVLLAMGFTGADSRVFADCGVHKVYDDYKTDSEEVYVAGDAKRGPSLVIWGIREGRMAAEAIHQSLASAADLAPVTSKHA